MTDPPADDSDVSEAVADLRARRASMGADMPEDRVERQHARGKLTAYERLEYLLDDGSFRELDTFVEHRAEAFGLADRTVPGDAVVTGQGTIDGRTVAVYAHDFTFLGGSVSEVVADKICKVMDRAIDNGQPIVGLNDSGGARIQEGLDALAGFARIFSKHTQASGVVPQISAIMGPCAGGATYAPALTDFVFMVEGTSNAFITGPDVVKTVTGEDVTKEDLGGASTHTRRSGVAHGSSPGEQALLDDIKRLLGYLPPHCGASPPRIDAADDPDRATPELSELVPEKLSKPYDVNEVVRAVMDQGTFYEVHAEWARNLVTGFARLDGRAVGVLANQPKQAAGTLDIQASQKGARFVRFCDSFNLPVVTLVDVPGFMPGTKQEHGGIIRHGAKLIYAYADATVPLLTVVTRKAYGGAYIVMGSKYLGADTNFAWPGAEMAVLGPQPAVDILFSDEIAAADDPEAERDALIAEFREEFANPYGPARRGYVDDIIEPRETRARLIADLATHEHRPAAYPDRSHGNIPL
jgi:acetyl-CoA/propionyl-CoA carboxylase carboxyl transferase subunit